jgi:MYXO-CTERM domain-containing protein
MKRILLLAALLGTAVSSFAQGVVLFNNRVNASGVDAPIYGNFVGGILLDGANFRAALYGTNGAGRAETDLVLLANPTTGATWAPFRTGTTAGYLNVGTEGPRQIGAGGYGAQVTLQVRAWEGSQYNTYEAALAGGARVGKSNLITILTTTSATDPVIPAMVGLQSFALVPEPSSIALGLLGLGALALIRRRK